MSTLCRELPQLRAVADETGDRAALESIVAAVRRGERVIDRVNDLGLLPLLTEWQTRSAEEHPTVLLPGSGPGHVPVGSFRCPAGICARVERPGPGEDRPVCALRDTPLRFG